MLLALPRSPQPLLPELWVPGRSLSSLEVPLVEESSQYTMLECATARFGD